MAPRPSKRLAGRITLSAMLFAGLAPFMAAYQQKAAPAKPQPITVDKVIKMVQAGVAEEDIIDALKKANTPMALSPEDLISLKQNHVSDIIKSMMSDPSTIPPPPDIPRPREDGVDPNDPRAAHDPGIYLFAKDSDGNPLMTILDKASPRYPRCVARLPINPVGVTFSGAQATVRTKDTQPVFYFYFEKTGGTSAFADTSLATPNQFTLAPLLAGKKGRQYKLTGQCEASTKTALKFKVERDRPGVYRLTVPETLSVGDYAFFGSGPLPEDVFDFGVDNQ